MNPILQRILTRSKYLASIQDKIHAHPGSPKGVIEGAFNACRITVSERLMLLEVYELV